MLMLLQQKLHKPRALKISPLHPSSRVVALHAPSSLPLPSQGKGKKTPNKHYSPAILRPSKIKIWDERNTKPNTPREQKTSKKSKRACKREREKESLERESKKEREASFRVSKMMPSSSSSGNQRC
jgi:hypothetical protein